MKTNMLIALSLLSLAACDGIRSKDVPAPVKDKFASLYPAMKEPDWEKEKENYEAGFKDASGKEASVLIDASGKLLETETGVEVTELPKTVTDYVAAKYKGSAIKEAARIENADGVMTYEAEVKGKDLIFDSKGNFLKETED